MFGCVGVWVCRRMNASRPRLASITRTILLVLAGTFFVVLLEGAVWADDGDVKWVDCTQGGTISYALRGSGDDPVTIIVKGTCNESVRIRRPRVTLKAATGGGTVSGLDPNSPAILITSEDTVINGLAVSGGINGIHVRGAHRTSIRNCLIRFSTRSGILFSHSSEGTVDNCTVQNNGTHGISINGSSASIFNSNISANTQHGVFVAFGANAFIGINPFPIPVYAGNTIANNGANGMSVVDGGVAVIGGNAISGNGTDTGSIRGRSGVNVGIRGAANLVGNNTIILNKGGGVVGSNGAVIFIGNPGFGLSTLNTISQNNAANLPGNGGITGFLGTSMAIQGAEITGNTGSGLTLSLRSTAQIVGGGSMAISNNTGNGILLALGSGLFLSGPPPAPVAVTNNGTVFPLGWGISCVDAESSFLGSTAGFSGNGLGSVNPNCTGF